MLSYLFKIFSLLIFSFIILLFYYFVFPGHLENFNGYFYYFLFLGIFYGIYKFFQIYKNNKETIFSPIKIIGFFILNLFILCIFFFSLGSLESINGIELFFKILFFSFLPITIIFISTGFGNKLTSFLPNKEDFGDKSNFIFSVGLGFSSFLFLISIFAILGIYNLAVVFFILLFFVIFSYKNIFFYIEKLFTTKYVFDIKEGSYIRLLSLEFFFLVAFIVLGVALISIYRPYPIGWDDLGVYMNHPHLMAESGSALSLGGMYVWQIFTGIGYMFKTPVAAFFLNISGTFLSFIILNIVFSDFFKTTFIKKSFLHIPSFLATLFISLPMVVFQTSKDMKVDEGLFFISVVLLYIIYKYFILLKEGKKISLIYILIIGLLTGLAFSIKFTALLLIVGVLGLISYFRVGLLGFFGYFSIFLGIFTLGNFWKMMNVVVNPNNIAGFEKNFGIGAIAFGIALILFSLVRNKNNLMKCIKEVSIFFIGMFITLSPWLIKNTIEAYPNISVSGIIAGKSETFRGDYTSIYTEKEIEEIKDKKNKNSGKKLNSVTTNEDLMRYFGYEKGILNFIKMPWNLTMQKNQGGEFTDIGFLFLAFIPLIFIFLPYKNKSFYIFFILFAIFEIIFFLPLSHKSINNDLYSGVSKTSLEGIFKQNDYVLSDKYFSRDIYDISINNYITDQLIKDGLNQEDIDKKVKNLVSKLVQNASYKKFKLLSKNKQTQESFNKIYVEINQSFLKDYKKYFDQVYKQEFDNLKSLVYDNFYAELGGKVKETSPGKGFTFVTANLSDRDFEIIKDLNSIYLNSSLFIAEDIVSLNEKLDLNKISKKDIEIINKIWKENRTLKGKVIDFFAKTNLPVGYIYILIFFFLPIVFLLFTLKEDDEKIVKIFKLNLVFSGVYTFLWLISSFGIVWYGITMYFSFLLMIGTGAYYLSSYDQKDGENVYLVKLIGSFAFLCIISFYFLNSVIPHNFTNLKKSSFVGFKTGQFSQASSIFLYHKEYKKLLFTMNIKDDKKEEFLEKNISKEILKAVVGIEKKDINEVFEILEYYKNNKGILSLIANRSLENLYKGILNPEDKFKNDEKIYRVGTFLKYYISENNKRLLEDNLLFTFNDYIAGENNSITISRLKKLGIKYLLVDLNAATIDMSETHDLTNRYEKMLKTFTSKQVELIESDSVCLKLGLDKFKESRDFKEYMILAGTNYESYENGKKINRGLKKTSCVKFIDYLLENDLVNEKKFSYLLSFKKYFENKDRSLDAINSLIPVSYNALFEIK